MPNHTDPLTAALTAREREYTNAIDRFRDTVNERMDDTDPDAEVEVLREAVELVRCLRRLVAKRTAHEIHEAFGAPGDFGYNTTIGAALAKVYGL